MILTGRAGLVALVLIAFVALTPAPGLTLLYANLVLLALVVLDVVLAGSAKRLAFERRLPASARLGEAARSELLVRNDGRRVVRGRLRDAWPPSAGVRPSAVGLAGAGGERRRVEGELTPTRRGDRRPRAVVVRSLGPLGLGGRQRTLSAPARVRVLPEFRSRALLPE